MNILVIGDSILDIYLKGNVSRISPEAPVPVFINQSKRLTAGGAANVACNLSALGIKTTLLTIFGDDFEAKELIDILNNHNVEVCSIISKNCPTITKTRFAAKGQQLLRHDKEKIFPIDESHQLFIKAKSLISKFDYLLFSDYNKGCLKGFDSSELLRSNKNLKIFLDPKKENFSLFKNSFLIKPNLQEFNLLLGDEFINLQKSRNLLETFIRKFKCRNLLLTLGEEGMILVSGNQKHEVVDIEEFTTHAQNVFDVTGAGDTVIASLTASIIKGNSLKQSVIYSNLAASLAVSKFGTYVIQQDDLSISNKNNNAVVFTNGCFDLIHIGHIKLLKYCRSLGNRLIVGLNSDDSIKKIKGLTRPINDQKTRKTILESFEFVDEVIIFNEDTPINLIKKIKPMFLIKGGDYDLKEIVGYEYVINSGGQVKTFPLVEGYSSTATINKINSGGS